MTGAQPDVAWSVQTGIDLDAMLAANAGWIERVRHKTKRDYQRDKPVLQRVYESLRMKYETGFSTSSYKIAEDLQLAQSVVYRSLRKLVSCGLAETFLTHGRNCFRPTGLEPTKGFDWNEILTKTRGWYSLDVNHPIKELSVIDLIRMYKQDYIPYWMDPVTKRIKVS